MFQGICIFASSLFILAASCYLLFLTSDTLEEVGEKLGKLFHLPEDVIASTFCKIQLKNTHLDPVESYAPSLQFFTLRCK